MSSAKSSAVNDAPAPRVGSLRLWPGVLAVALQWVVRFVVPAVVPGTMGVAVSGALLGGLAVVVWWVFLSRAARSERYVPLVVVAVVLGVTYSLNHRSMAQFWLLGFAVPVLSLAFVAWAAASRRLPEGWRRAALVATVLVACGGWTLVKNDGITGDGAAEFAWRWSQTPEERLLARGNNARATIPSDTGPARSDVAWPGFRGPHRDGVVPGVQLATDWARSPPVELWRRPVGPGWSSFAVSGDRIYTQEQRGDEEVVVCYSATTGDLVWKHGVAARFWESQAGPGPRATPTLGGGRVIALGATGALSVLDAADGSVVWARDAASDTGAEIPIWGFSGSPLLFDDIVIVAVSGKLVAYDLSTGEPRWFGPTGGVSYSSPQLFTLDGVEQVLMLGDQGAMGVVPADGTLLWEHAWPGFRIVQSAQTADGDVVLCSERNGIRRLAVTREPDGWSVAERWTSNRLKPYFSDFVVHRGHAFGFDGSILASIDLADGERRWKGGRYGHGQLLLLPESDLLLVLTEQGDLALIAATPDEFKELARAPAIGGKTWNHPVLSGDLLLVRNGQEMAAFRLPPAGDP